MSRTVVVKLPTDFCTLNTPLYILTPFFSFFSIFFGFFWDFFSGIISAERDAGAEKTTLPSSPQKSPLLFLSAAQESTRGICVARFRSARIYGARGTHFEGRQRGKPNSTTRRRLQRSRGVTGADWARQPLQRWTLPAGSTPSRTPSRTGTLQKHGVPHRNTSRTHTQPTRSFLCKRSRPPLQHPHTASTPQPHSSPPSCSPTESPSRPKHSPTHSHPPPYITPRAHNPELHTHHELASGGRWFV